jgi:DNA-directed RNA polymerase subunit RPC12/RpoP
MSLEKRAHKQLSTRQEDYIEVEHHCCLCGTELEFFHNLDDLSLKVKEKAQCPKCHVQLKEREHTLH